jgi:hypothetical protein
MATLGASALTYMDHAKRMDPDGAISRIVNILSQTNELLSDMLVSEGNLPTGHQTTLRTSLPSATWRLINGAVTTTKSTTAQITDTCGMLETLSDIDVDLCKLNGNTAEFRLSEDMAFIEGMNQQMASAYWYSNALATPDQIMGLAPRLSTLNTSVAQTANQVIDGGGVGSTNTSIYIVGWGPNTVQGIFPKGSVAGLQQFDLGEQRVWVTVGSGTQSSFQAYSTRFQWKTGLSVRDYRFVVRIANIDTTQLLTGNAPNLINAIIRGIGKFPVTPVGVGPVQESDAPEALSAGRTVIYMNRVAHTYLDLQALNKINVQLTQEQWHGHSVTTFRGIPIRTSDALLNTEARVV